MLQHVALFAVGLLLLAAGAGCLVVGAARLDRRIGRSPFAVGVVAAAFGPCVASLAFALTAVTHERPQLALRTILGCNVASVGLVLGAAALARPVAAAGRLFGAGIPFAIVATLLFWLLARDGSLSRVDAGVLLAAFAGALAYLVRTARREPDAVKAEFAASVPERMPLWAAAVLGLAGLAGVIGGALAAVAGAMALLRHAQTPTPILGLTSAAFAASLPALAAAVVMSRRGRSDVVLALVVGPMLVNLLLTAGVVALVATRPLEVTPRAVMNELPALGLFAFLLLPALLNGGKVARWEGAILLAAYAGFVAWQVAATR